MIKTDKESKKRSLVAGSILNIFELISASQNFLELKQKCAELIQAIEIVIDGEKE